MVVNKPKKSWVKADSMDTPMDTKIGDMDTHGYKYRDKEKRKEQMREYTRKRRLSHAD